ncbi:MAG: hypothetical protein H0U03_02735 [Actinobacteria bacterium]|nr:hypothetical protein [Actinomycetota bacterium]
MSHAKRRAALEEIAYSADASPADRMRALEALREYQGVEPNPALVETSDQELFDTMDDELSSDLLDIIASVLDGRDISGSVAETTWNGWPRTVENIASEINRRVTLAVEEHTDVARVELEIEQRAQEKAEHLYRTRSFSAVSPSDGLEGDQEGEQPTSVPGELKSPPTLPPGIDLERGWPKPRGRNPNTRRLGDRRRSW